MSDVVLIPSSDDESPPTKKSKPTESPKSPPEITANPKNDNLEEIETLYESSKEIREMLTICYKKISSTKIQNKFMDKVRLLKPHFDVVGREFTQEDWFVDLMRERVAFCASNTMGRAIDKFVELFKELEQASKNMSRKSDDNPKIGKERAAHRLERMLRKLNKRIAQLEEAEVDLDDEESSYIKMQRYRERADKVYVKWCEYRNEEPYSWDVSKQKINFSGSNDPLIDKAINKKFKNGTNFPTYGDVVRCISDCVSKHNLNLSRTDINKEARDCFEKLGNLLQKRRRVELFYTHNTFLKDNQNAPQDSDLLEKLNHHRVEAEKATSAIIHKYVKMQEEGVEVEVSEDSDDSDHNTEEENSN